MLVSSVHWHGTVTFENGVLRSMGNFRLAELWNAVVNYVYYLYFFSDKTTRAEEKCSYETDEISSVDPKLTRRIVVNPYFSAKYLIFQCTCNIVSFKYYKMVCDSEFCRFLVWETNDFDSDSVILKVGLLILTCWQVRKKIKEEI